MLSAQGNLFRQGASHAQAQYSIPAVMRCAICTLKPTQARHCRGARASISLHARRCKIVQNSVCLDVKKQGGWTRQGSQGIRSSAAAAANSPKHHTKVLRQLEHALPAECHGSPATVKSPAAAWPGFKCTAHLSAPSRSSRPLPSSTSCAPCRRQWARKRSS